MSKKSLIKRVKSDATSPKNTPFDDNIRFIVPMPGKPPWNSSKQELTYKKFHGPKEISGDICLDDFRAQFLMQREYFID